MLFSSKHFYVRYFTMDDVETMFTYRSHPECQRYQDWKAPDLEEIHQFLHSIQGRTIEKDGETQLAICLKDSDSQIGDLYFVRNEETITIGYTLHPQLHRQGYGKEIVEAYVQWLQDNFPKHEIVAMVHPENLASCKLLDRLAFIKEGYEPKVDSIIYSLPAHFPGLSIWDIREHWVNPLRTISSLLNEWFGISPTVYGSIGVRLQVTVPFDVHDLDVLIPEKYLESLRPQLEEKLHQSGYQIKNEKVLCATKDGFDIEFSSREAWEHRCDFHGAVERVQQELFHVLSVDDLLALYQYLQQADFRDERKKQSDQEKITLLQRTIAYQARSLKFR